MILSRNIILSSHLMMVKVPTVSQFQPRLRICFKPRMSITVEGMINEVFLVLSNQITKILSMAEDDGLMDD